MEQDSLTYDSIARPLPEWLEKQKAGLNTYQPVKAVMKDDRSLQTSIIATGAAVLLIVILLTVYILRKKPGMSEKD